MPARSNLFRSILLAATLPLLPLFTLRAQSKNKPSIFYWGSLQATLRHDADTGRFSGEISTSPKEFRAAVQREPRLWDGSRLRQRLEFQLDTLVVQSDYYSPEIYGALQGDIDGYVAGLDSSRVVLLKNLPLNEGQFGVVRIFLSESAPWWLRDRVIYRPGADQQSAAGFFLEWGSERFDTLARQFFTVAEFWQIVQNEPVLHYPDGAQRRPGAWKICAMVRESSIESGRMNCYEDSSYNLRAQLDLVRHRIQAGNSVYFSTWDSLNPLRQTLDTIFMLDSATQQQKPVTRISWRGGTPDRPIYSTEPFARMEVAAMTLTPENDPRLSLRKNDRRDFVLRWGRFEQYFNGVFGRTFHGPDGAIIRPDAGFTYFNHGFTRSEMLDMMRQTAQLSQVSGAPVSPVQFKIEYRDQIYWAEDGFAPPELLQRLERDLGPYDKLRVYGLQAGEIDLSFAELIFEIRNDDPKPPIRQ